jgi:hypothetical protein
MNAPSPDQMPLEAEALLAAAREATALDDFGDAPLREPLGLLTASLRNEVPLSAGGRAAAARRLQALLSTRLRLQALWRRRPQILEQPLVAPWFIVGLPRTGTTFLHRLLANDAGLRTAPLWELMNPLPLGERSDPEAPQPEPDPRIALAEQALAALHRAAPDLQAMHEMHAQAPDEELNLLALGFASMGFEFSFGVPSYVQAYARQDHQAGYAFFRRVLQTLQWLHGEREQPRPWLLKAPSHMEQLRPLLQVFPDATVIHTHRDAATATVSLASLTASGRRAYIERPDPQLVGRQMSAAVERLLRALDRDRAEGDARFLDVQFAELMRDPIALVQRLYAARWRTLSTEAEAAMCAWLAANPRGKHGTHAYEAADFGIDLAERRAALAFYHRRFGVPQDR